MRRFSLRQGRRRRQFKELDRSRREHGHAPRRGRDSYIAAAVEDRAGGVSSTTHRYNLTLSLSVRNLTNHTNPGPIVGNITSPLFGQANQASGTGGGGGISESANNRRTEIQLRFAF